MGTASIFDPIRQVRQRVTSHQKSLRHILFGDRLGYVLFLGSIVFFMCYWRIGFLINDSYTIANTLLAVESGQLYFTEATYGKLGSPGTHFVDGKVYGRNYGQVFLALPFLIALRALSEIFDLSIMLMTGWSLLVLTSLLQLGRLIDHHRAAAFSGSLLSLCAFGIGVATIHPISQRALPVVALQVSTMIATAVGVVLIYRLVCRLHDQRMGAAAGLAYAVVLPTAFWASVPKRHALTTTLVIASFYLLYRARETSEPRVGIRFRAMAYVPAALAAWVHAPEGFVLLASVGLADMMTAESNARRPLAVIVTVLFLALIPFFLTNYLIVGSPLEPPRFLPSYETARITPRGGTDTAGGGAMERVASTLAKPTALLERFTDGFVVILTEPSRLIDIFLVGQGFESGDINLTFLESAPLLGLLAAGVVSLARGAGSHRTLMRMQPDCPEAVVRAAAIIYTVLLVLVYLPSLPLHTQITVRYLLPLYPIALLFIAQLEPVKGVLNRKGRLLGWTYAGGTLVGSQLFVAVIVLINALLREAMQLGALLSLAVAIALGGWAIAYTLGFDGDYAVRMGAVLVGIAAAMGTAFLLVSAWYYFPYGPFALPFVPGP